MDPYTYVRQVVQSGETLLSLCAGIGLELYGVDSPVTAVDISPQYLDRLNETHPLVKTVQSDALEYTKEQPDNSVDIISIIDGIEHMDKQTGLELITEMKRVCKKQILLFTPEGQGSDDGYLRNEPHNAWGIPGADEHQTHKSGWTQKELQKLDFKLILAAYDTSQHGESYIALMMKWVK